MGLVFVTSANEMLLLGLHVGGSDCTLATVLAGRRRPGVSRASADAFDRQSADNRDQRSGFYVRGRAQDMTGRAPSTVTCDLDLRLVGSGDSSLAVPVELRYDSSDPYAVHATFRTGGDHVSWVFARELLADGLRYPSGEGDVRVWPARERGGGVVFVGLSSPDGAALLEAPASSLLVFRKRTYAAVAHGAESAHLDIDGAVTRMLGDYF
jgi:Streptomyces sporulation and cell division protein, SsgA